jgi:hypothetical protein
VQNNNNARSGFTLLKKRSGMILRLLQGRGMVSGLFEKKRDAIPPHPAPPQALCISATEIMTCVSPDLQKKKMICPLVDSVITIKITNISLGT